MIPPEVDPLPPADPLLLVDPLPPVVLLPPVVGGVTPLPRWVVGADPLPLEVDPLSRVVDPLSPAVGGVTPLPVGVSGVGLLPLVINGLACVGLLPLVINGLACVGPVACFGCVVWLLATIPGLDDIAAIYCSAILACCLVVGSPLDGDHVLGAGLSGTGVLERNIFKASLADGANLMVLLRNNNDQSGNCPVMDTCGVVPLGVDSCAAPQELAVLPS